MAHKKPIPAHVQSVLEEMLNDCTLDASGPCKPVAVMTCGISGAGKSTFSHALVAQYKGDERLKFTRLSIDHIVFLKYGLYDRDYEKDKYDEYSIEAEELLKTELQELLLRRKQNVVIDLSFWSKVGRDEYKSIVEQCGARWMLVYFQASREVLQRRIEARKAGGQLDGDSSYDVTDEVFQRYLDGFEKPNGEGEITIENG